MVRLIPIILCCLFIFVGCSKNQETVKPNNESESTETKTNVTHKDEKETKEVPFAGKDIKVINIITGNQINQIPSSDSRYNQVVSLIKKTTKTNGAMCKCLIKDSKDLIENYSNGKAISIEFNREIDFSIKNKYADEPSLFKSTNIYLFLDDSTQKAMLYDRGLYELDDLTTAEELKKIME